MGCNLGSKYGILSYKLDPVSSQLCIIVLPWGKYEYHKLPMGLYNSLDISQEKMNELFSGFDYVQAYIDNLLIIRKGSFEDHLSQLDKVPEKTSTCRPKGQCKDI